MGMSAAINLAETARQQGVDLYAEMSARLRAGLEFHADYLLGKAVPGWLCGGQLDLRLVPMWEIAFNHYQGRLGLALPRTEALLARVRAGSPVYKHMAHETLTPPGWARSSCPDRHAPSQSLPYKLRGSGCGSASRRACSSGRRPRAH